MVDGSGQIDGIEDNSDPHVWEKRKSTLEKHLDIPKALDISLDGSTQNLKRIEKGVDLYLASINDSGKAAKSNGLWRRGIPTNTLPSVSVSPQDDKLEETSTLKLSPLLLPGVQSALNFKDERDGKLATKGKESNKDSVAHYASYGTNAPRKTFETETTEIQMKKTGLLHHKKDAKTENSHSDILQKGKSSASKILKERKPVYSERNQSLETSLCQESESMNKNIKNKHSNDTSCENRQNPDVSQEHKDGERCQRGNQLSPLLKPSPPYLVSKPSRTVRATTNLASVRPACIRACMERTVTMVYVEDSDVETPKSSFDIDAWLAFIRQKKGYSATLKDGPLERPSDGSNATDKASCSKRNVKFALGKKKLKSLRPPCKTCRDRAMEWFKEFSKTDKKGKKHSSSKKLNPLKTEGLPNLHALSSSRLQEAGSGGYSAELPRIKREDPSQLLQRIREDSKMLQEKVHHLCNDAYWKFWSNNSLDNDA